MSKAGTVADAEASYRTPHSGKVKRLWLGSILGALAAVLLVAFCALVIGVLVSLITNVFFNQQGSLIDGGFSGDSALLMGMVGAFFAALFNWYIFYITIPITTLILRFSLGRFPKRGISRPGPYFRWGAIWGAVLVLLPSLFAGYVVGGTSGFDLDGTSAGPPHIVLSLLGASLIGILIGGVSGIGVSGLFLLIVKPAKQMLMTDPAAEF